MNEALSYVGVTFSKVTFEGKPISVLIKLKGNSDRLQEIVRELQSAVITVGEDSRPVMDEELASRKEQHEPLCKTSRALPIGSVGCICDQIKHTREIDSALQERNRCYKYAVTLLKSLVPSCEPLTTLMGVLSQIDTWCSGQKNWATEKEELLDQFNQMRAMDKKE